MKRGMKRMAKRLKSRIPAFHDEKRICIICEGPEEYDYIDRLNKIGVWNNNYIIIPKSADGNGNIPALYQDCFQNDSYDLVLVFCDTEKKPFEQYGEIKRKINIFHGIDDAARHIVIYGNPCTLQIVLLHWCEEVLSSPSKKANAKLVERNTGIENYRARTKQRTQIMELINIDNFEDMRSRLSLFPDDDTIIGSTNFERFVDYFTRDDTGWISEINEILTQ